jgi:phosphoglycolate phosphatase-like HAD superfamily hydrolase
MINLFIDFDGVLVNSNDVKTRAFRNLGEKFFGFEAGVALERFHLENPGKSRFEKISFICDLVEEESSETRQEFLNEFRELVFSSIQRRERSELITALAGSLEFRSHIVSAAPSSEIIELAALFGWKSVFEGRIYGSPPTKHEIFEGLSGGDALNGVMIGDSPSDWEVAKAFNLDFVFISGWTWWEPKAEEQAQFSGLYVNLDEFLLELTIHE